MKHKVLVVSALLGVCAVLLYAGPNDLKDEGVGTYTDPSVASQISNFTNPLCTPSTVVPGKCRFGGVLVTDSTGMNQMGDVTVGP
jgi:hypothetical protein